MTAVKKVVIVGGGTAGWMAAAALSQLLGKRLSDITLIESPDVPSVGVGEATIPGIRNFIAHLGIDEVDFIKRTQASFKLGIQFEDWRHIGSIFFHPFADYGTPIQGIDFHQCLYHTAVNNDTDVALADYCLPTHLAKRKAFAQPPEYPQHPLADYKYAFHLDAVLLADMLKEYAIQKDVKHKPALVNEVIINDKTGFISKVTTQCGASIEGDLFLDCTGFAGLLIDKTLRVNYEDWSHWLPVNRAIAIPSAGSTLNPYTVSKAHEAGWTWRIPLQHRTGNGYVYCADFTSDDRAQSLIEAQLEGDTIADAKRFRFTTGRRSKFWHKNCVALGLASGFIEPLESTSISLIQTGISRLMMLFPDHGFNDADIAEANRLAATEMEHIRDFIILHYCLNQRSEAFWQHMRSIELPDTLKHKLELYRHRGHIVQHELESFEAPSWLSIYDGMGLRPRHFDPRASELPLAAKRDYLKQLRHTIDDNASKAMSHADFIARHCAARH